MYGPPLVSPTSSALPLSRAAASTTAAAAAAAAAAGISGESTTVGMSKTIPEQKKALRAVMKKALKALSPAQRAQEELAIQNEVLKSDWFKSSKRLCAYISCAALKEVDTSRILSEVLRESNSENQAQSRKEIYVPRVEDKNSNMRMLKITNIEELVANSMNILEPSPIDDKGNEREDVMMATQPVDLFLLPGLAFDSQGRRLGRGGGYYDAFLKKYWDLAVEKKWNQPLLVALAYSVQITEDGVIPVTPIDYPVDAVVSPTGVIPISSAAKERM